MNRLLKTLMAEMARGALAALGAAVGAAVVERLMKPADPPPTPEKVKRSRRPTKRRTNTLPR